MAPEDFNVVTIFQKSNRKLKTAPEPPEPFKPSLKMTINEGSKLQAEFAFTCNSGCYAPFPDAGSLPLFSCGNEASMCVNYRPMDSCFNILRSSIDLMKSTET
jgi:hypothetical protein